MSPGCVYGSFFVCSVRSQLQATSEIEKNIYGQAKGDMTRCRQQPLSEKNVQATPTISNDYTVRSYDMFEKAVLARAFKS
jgi:hypothetical protein